MILWQRFFYYIHGLRPNNFPYDVTDGFVIYAYISTLPKKNLECYILNFLILLSYDCMLRGLFIPSQGSIRQVMPRNQFEVVKHNLMLVKFK